MAQRLDESLSRSLPEEFDEWPCPRSPAEDKWRLTVGEIAREFGITPRALRFYEGKGLLSPARQGAARSYGRVERERLILVLKAKRLGFTLDEIRRMLAQPGDSSETSALSMTRRQCFDQIKLLEGRKREIETALADLRRTYSSFYARLVAGAV